MDDEQRQRKLLAEQIARAQAEAGPSNSGGPTLEDGLQRDPETKLSFSFGGPKPASPPTADESLPSSSAGPSNSASSDAPSSSSTAPAPAVKIGFSNPLKRPASSSNVFKMGSSKKAASSSVPSTSGPSAKLSAAEQLMKEDAERKRRMAENRGSGGFVGGKRVKL